MEDDPTVTTTPDTTVIHTDTTEVTAELVDVHEDARRLFPWWLRGFIYVGGTMWAAGFGVAVALPGTMPDVWMVADAALGALVGIVAAANLTRPAP